jgi:hypothetical protein
VEGWDKKGTTKTANNLERHEKAYRAIGANILIISDGRINIVCRGCGRSRDDVGFDISMMYLWSNQYGKSIRMFCHCCGWVWTVTDIYSKELQVTEHTQKVSILNEYR